MNKWVEVVMAWFLGGLIGRLIGHTYLVGYLGWPEVSGWLSVPIGSAIAWLAVEVNAIVPAIKHAYRWTQKPMRLERLMICCHEFKDNWGWHVLDVTSFVLFFEFWLVAVVGTAVALARIVLSGKEAYLLLLITGLVSVFSFLLLYLSVRMAIMTHEFMEARGWDRFFSMPCTKNKVRNRVIGDILSFLLLNPVSVWLIMPVVVISYYSSIAVKEIFVWFGKVIWKTIQMVNSSQRMAAMTGAAIGLSISQICGYNPAICGGVCVLAGLVERTLFILAEKFMLGPKVKRTA